MCVRFALVSCVLASFAAGADPARADDLKLELGGFVGAHFFSDKNSLGRLTDTQPLALNDFLIFGPRVALAGDRLAMELEWGLIPTKTHNGAANVWVDAFRMHARVALMDGRFRPFVLAGVGVQDVLHTSNTGAITNDTVGALHAGLAAAYDIGPSWGLRADVRSIFTDGVAAHNWAVDWEALLGFYARFDLTSGQGGAVTGVDSDGDGVRDAADVCPTQPETRNGYHDADGCPDEIPAAVRQFSGKIDDIQFETGSATINPRSNAVLDRAAQALRDYPDIELTIEGHTDNVGTREMNLDLSKRRAESVRAYFVAKGIAADRLKAEGYGPDKPEVSNDTEAGRTQNRRVEFRLSAR